MIEIMHDLPTHVIAFRATGKVTRDDYEKILMPAVDEHSKNFKKINFLLWLDTDVTNYTFGAWVEDAMLGLKHFTHWHKVAIISHSDAVKKITNIFGHVVPGTYKGFSDAELDLARKWISEP